ncbi:potassium channel subfamily K member 5-like [Polyodon spathula]|uniref:potassium channel subfamily K member 5-like n=1 Tax=Polyodon spathula TaxID=7913 RepID=UPI001B7F492F|nr:potassium channel subfamily K member 5-like [Polyodon spathula]
MMVDKGPLLTSAIIFYLSIGAAIFQVLEEPNWKSAVHDYELKKTQILKDYPCLKAHDLEKILEVVSSAAGQGITITGNKTFNNWNWPNAVIFAATVITTIGYGNIAPKTSPGRVFCIFYGLFGVPLCLTWISALGKFFGGRAKHLGQFLTKRGVSLRKAQFTCTAIFVIWGALVHLVIPPFVFMVTEGWSYIEGLYFSFVTISTIGFGDLVAGVDPNADYHVLYRYFVELWIYLGLAWLSLFINWKVSMFVEVHKALKKRRKRRKESVNDQHHHHKSKKDLPPATTTASKTPTKDVNIFNFLSKKKVGYLDLMKEIGSTNDTAVHRGSNQNKILSFDSSPRLKRSCTQGDMEMYSMNNGFLYGNPSILQTMENRGLLHPLGEKEELELDIFENQLDKDERENGGQWNSKGYHALIFQNANISFIDEDNLMEEEESKGEFSLDDNVQSELESKEEEERNSESEGSFFSTDSSENSLSYEELVGEYVKVDNTAVRT